MIAFWATVHLDAKGRKTPLTGPSYRPNFRFHGGGLQDQLWGMGELKEADWPFSPGETKRARFGIYGYREVCEALFVGIRFTLQEGPKVVGSAIIEEIEYNEIDEDYQPETLESRTKTS
jgi:hypothetical protein